MPPARAPRQLRWPVCFLLLAPLGACQRDLPIGPEPGHDAAAARTAAAPSPAGDYIVVLKPGPAARAQSEALQRQHARRVLFDYQTALVGFAAELPGAAADALRRNPAVAYVERDGEVVPTGFDGAAGWAVGRIDQRYGPSDHAFSYATTGQGVNIYILDTGINVTHPDFGGRAAGAWSWDPAAFPAGQDCNGHGTAVASVAGGGDFGVARGARLWSVRARDCAANGARSRYIAAMDWVARHHVKPAVLNLSFEVWDATGLNSHYAVRDAAIGVKAAGVFVVAAAGNRSTDACSSAPANALPIMTVAATDPTDTRPAFSNYGGCVDLFAPGVSVDGARHTGGYTTWTGTSFAAPIVAGIAALLLERYPHDTPDQIHYAIRDGATTGVVRSPGPSSPNLLAYSSLPAPVQASIGGPTVVGPYMTCTWTANVRGGRGPFRYRWFGVLAGTSNTVSGRVSGPGWLNLEVWDALGGYASTSLQVSVNPWNTSLWCGS